MKLTDLFKSRSISGLFVSQTTGAFNDNALKMILIGLFMSMTPADRHDSFLALINALLITPFVLLSPLAGWLSDRISKRTVLLAFKGTEFIILGLALAALYVGSLRMPFFILLLMGVQSAFYSPSKYGILKEITEERRMGQLNGMMEMGTIFAIVAGSVGGAFLFDIFKSPAGGDRFTIPLIILFSLSIAGFIATLFIEKVPSGTAERFRAGDFFRDVGDMMKNRTLRLIAAGITFFWFSAMLLNLLLLLFGTQTMGLENFSAASLLFLYLSVGVATGSLMAGKMSRYRVERGLIPAGAIGIMQLLPETGRAMGVGDIRRLEPNIHAGVKYLRSIMDRYFDDPQIDEQNRTLFAVAAYNAGPTRVSRLRGRAERQGLDDDLWFDNVEITAGRALGREPVLYVRDVFKYYAAYKLQLESRAEREAAREALKARRAD